MEAVATSTFTPTNGLKTDSVFVKYKKPIGALPIIKVIANPHQISVNDSLNLTVQVVLSNGIVGTSNNHMVKMRQDFTAS